MCGIAGIISNSLRSDALREAVELMTTALKHRGPDGHLIKSGEGFGVGATRLAIRDVQRGAQPMVAPSGLITSLNGEIYNYQALRDLLEARGCNFKTDCDTELLAPLFSEFSYDCVKLIEGMFSFSIYNPSSGELFVARDRFGIKPFFYYANGGTFVYSSELRSLLQSSLVPRSLDLLSLNQYLAFEYVPSPRTILSAVQRLESGHSMRWNARTGISLIRYWRPNLAASEMRPPVRAADQRSAFRSILSQSVVEQCISDVPIGVLLSGGIDSSAVLAYASEAGQKSLPTFSMAFEDESVDEGRYSQLVAKAFNAQHHELKVSQSELAQSIRSITGVLDEPLADSSFVPTYLLSKFVASHVKVVLGGDGGDELFVGYPTYQGHAAIEYYERLLPRTLRQYLVPFLVGILPRGTGHLSMDYKMRRFLSGRGVPVSERHCRWLGSFEPVLRKEILSENLRAIVSPGSEVLDRHFEEARCNSALNRLLYADMMTFLEGDILTKVDRASMANGLEVRVPWLSTPLAEFACALPIETKFRGLRLKNFVKKALRGVLPDQVLDRRKQGFNIAVGRLLRAELKELLMDELSEEKVRRQGLFNIRSVRTLIDDHLRCKVDRRKEIWTLLTLQRWLSNVGLS